MPNMNVLSAVVTCLVSLVFVGSALQLNDQGPTTSKPVSWTGRWLPESLKDSKHGVKMGISSTSCDDAKTNLGLDWDNSPINFTCYDPRNRLLPDSSTEAVIEYQNIPKAYSAKHQCMDQPIHYNETVPTFGTHRPLWPKYGEYKFVPLQRWLHNLEHGGIVMLYHPCANPTVVNQLRRLVTNCLRRHVITPYNLLDSERPLALVAWGARLRMSTVQENTVEGFIKQHALKGPEQVAKQGQYDHELLNLAAIVTDFTDSTLCPHKNTH